MEGGNPQEIRAAIVAATGEPGPKQESANDFLTNFLKSPDAWGACIQLLRDPSKNIKYYSANMLLSKVRSEWVRSEESVQSRVMTAFHDFVGAVATGGVGFEAAVIERVASAWASAAALTGPSAMKDYIAKALSPGQRSATAIALSLELLKALAAEVLSRPHRQKSDVSALLREQRDSLLGLLRVACLGGSSDPGNGLPGPMATKAIAVFNAVFQHVVDLATCFEKEPMLIRVLTASLTEGSYEAAEESATALSDILQATFPPLPTRAEREDPLQQRRLALEDNYFGSQGEGSGAAAAASDPRRDERLLSVLEYILKELDRTRSAFDAHIQNKEEDSEERAYFLVKVYAATLEAASKLLLEGNPVCKALLQCLLEAATFPALKVRELVAEFWPKLSGIPSPSRPEPLRQPIWKRIMDVSLRASALPPSFTSWDEFLGDTGIDEDSFDRFREQLLQEVFEAALLELGPEFFVATTALFESAVSNAQQNWPQAEAAFTAIRLVHPKLKEARRSEGGPQAAVWQAASQCLDGCFRAIAAKEAVITGHWMVAVAACRLTSMLAVALVDKPQHIEGVVAFSLTAFKQLEVGKKKYAAAASRSVGSKFRLKLGATPEILDRFMAAIEGGREAGANSDDIQELTQGAVRILSAFPPDKTTDALERVLAPSMRALQAATASGLHDEAAVAAAVRDVEAVGTALRFAVLPAPPGAPPPAVHALRRSWPVLSDVADAAVRGGEAGEPAVLALCEALSAALESVKTGAASLLPDIAPMALRLYQIGLYPSAIDLLAKVCEVFGPTAPEPVLGKLGECLHEVFSIAIRLMKKGISSDNISTVESEGLAAAFDLGRSFHMFAPAPLLTAPSLSALMKGIASHVKGMEPISCRAALLFVARALSIDTPAAHEDASEQKLAAARAGNRDRLVAALTAEGAGQGLLQSFLEAFVAEFPDSLLDPMAQALFSLLHGNPGGAKAMIPSILCHPTMPAPSGPLPPAAAEAFTASLLHCLPAATPSGPTPTPGPASTNMQTFRRLMFTAARYLQNKAPLEALRKACDAAMAR